MIYSIWLIAVTCCRLAVNVNAALSATAVLTGNRRVYRYFTAPNTKLYLVSIINCIICMELLCESRGATARPSSGLKARFQRVRR